MKIKKHLAGLMQVNCYLVWDEDSKMAMVIDPGGDAKKIARTIKEKGLTLMAIVHTHGHWDHTAGSDSLQRLTGAPVLRHPLDAKSGYLHRPRPSDGVKVHDLEDGQDLNIGGLRFKVIHTPGHSRGGICLYTPGSLFSGDLLFSGSVGRWDLSGGSFRELVKSLNQRLAALPDDTDVYPGHGPAAALGLERAQNPFFKTARDLKRGG
ncbi:MAG TPA: MBL fold metallo-hydrolase [bacterium]|nr:MBL fold metallo-hydrolase [bacterium]